jgi:hypothetical protein
MKETVETILATGKMTCRKCCYLKLLPEFHGNVKMGAVPYNRTCKVCANIADAARRKLRRQDPTPRKPKTEKTCPGCKRLLPAGCFGRDEGRADKMMCRCKECVNAQDRESYDPARQAVWNKLYRAREPGKWNANATAYRIRKAKAMPAWADIEKITAIYEESARLNREAGRTLYNVDHFYPLGGELVCGLHVHQNLQIIPKIDNLRKYNRLLD